MRMLNGKLLAGLSVGMIALSGCTQIMILFKPSAQMDPMPTYSTPEKPLVQAKDAADPLLDKQWSLKSIGVTADLLKTPTFAGNANVKIAILSTGVDYNHEDLIGQVYVNKEEISQKAAGDKPGVDRVDNDKNGLVDDVVGYDVVDGDGFAYDRHGAGTAVAGIIAAKANNGLGIAGLMKNVSLYPVRYIDNNGSTNVQHLSEALTTALKFDPHIIFVQNAQIQLGGRRAKAAVAAAEIALLRQALDAVKAKGIPVVIGAGDDMDVFGQAELEKVLASYENVFPVSSLDKTSKPSMLSNGGQKTVVLAAPGEEIMTLKPGNKYGEVHGTAYAAAHVTAALGLIRAKQGQNFRVQEIRNLLLSPKAGDYDKDLFKVTLRGTRLNMTKLLKEAGL